MDNIEEPSNNVNVLDPHHKIIAVKNAAAGDLPNEKIKICYICKNNGWSHEAITFERVLGRVLSDGHNETKGWIVRDYFTGQIHRHRSNKQE
jgi:hypothetical protein